MPILTPNECQQKAAEIAAQYGVPANIFYPQIRKESGCNTNARGGLGEIGLGQILPATGASECPDLNWRIDPVANLQCAARYLKKQFNATGDWRLALEAYNGGLAHVKNGTVSLAAKKYADDILKAAGEVGATVSSAVTDTVQAVIPEIRLSKQTTGTIVYTTAALLIVYAVVRLVR
jgi:soluble lytic murein transglycosylase-like protein